MVEGYPDSLGGWGAPAIFKEGGRLLSKYFRLLHPFILAFLLPAALIQLLEVLGMSWIFSHHSHHRHHHHHHHHHFPGHFPHHHHHHHHFGLQGFIFSSYKVSEGSYGSGCVGDGACAPAPMPPHHHPHILPLLIGAAVSILMWLLVSLAVAAISKAVAYIYSNNEDPSVIKSIFKSLPGALYRLFITTLWFILITFVTVFVVSLPFHLLMLIFKTKLNPRIIAILNAVFVYIALLLLGFTFLLAQEIAVLEPSNYGLAALKRSSKLVQAKLPAALIFFLVNIIAAGLLSKLTRFAIFFPATGELPFWTVYIFAVLIALLYLLFWVYFLLVAIVLYFASKVKFEADEQYLPVQSGEDNPYTPLVVPAEN